MDPAFVSDNCWFLFPFHAYWDHQRADVPKTTRTQNLPYTGHPARPVWSPVTYLRRRLHARRHLVKSSSAATTASETNCCSSTGEREAECVVIATWDGYKMAGPILGLDGPRGYGGWRGLHAFFSDVAVKLAGSDTWVDAQ